MYGKQELAMKMWKPWLLLFVCLTLLLSGCLREVSFKRDLQPVLQRNCLPCHKAGGEGYVASGFSMETYDNLMHGTKFGPMIIPGESINSSFIRLMDHKTDSAIHMPRNSSKLSARDIEMFEKWVDAGAPNN